MKVSTSRLAAFATLALAVVAAALLPACGGAGSEEVQVTQAAVRTVDAGSSRISVTATVDGLFPGAGKPEIRGDGVVDSRARRGRLLLDVSIPGFEPRPLAIVPGEEPSRLPFVTKKSRVEEIFTTSEIYLRGLPIGQRLPKGREWVSIDVERVGRGQGLDLGGLSELFGGDPRRSLDILRAASEDVEEIGREKVREVEATRFRATVDLARYPDLVAPGERARVRRAIDQLIELLGRRTLPVEVWVDGEGLIRRTRQVLPVPGAPIAANAAVEVELYDFGTDAEVEIPSERETVSLEHLFQRIPTPRAMPGVAGLPKLERPRGESKLPRIELPPGSVDTCDLRSDEPPRRGPGCLR